MFQDARGVAAGAECSGAKFAHLSNETVKKMAEVDDGGDGLG